MLDPITPVPIQPIFVCPGAIVGAAMMLVFLLLFRYDWILLNGPQYIASLLHFHP
jgi:hypothetical protein